MRTTDGDWTFTFCDMVTRQELATLPLTGVDYTRQISGAGKLDAYLPLSDQKVRALDPWMATVPRRTALNVEFQERPVWGGPVLLRDGGDDVDGMTITAITWEGWLHRQRLLSDLDLPSATRFEAAVALLEAIGAVPIEAGGGQGGSIAFGVRTDTPGSGPPAGPYWYRAADVKPLLELLEQLGTDEPLMGMEFRVDITRDEDGLFYPTLVLGEPRLGTRYEDTALTFAYPSGGLLRWKYAEDGGAASNVLLLLGSGSGTAQPFDYLTGDEIGIDELTSGFPTWMEDLRLPDTNDPDVMLDRGAAAMRAGHAASEAWSGVRVDPVQYLGRVSPGDDLALEVVHKRFRSWPQSVTHITRVLGEAVTVGSGGKGDSVKLTIGGAP